MAEKDKKQPDKKDKDAAPKEAPEAAKQKRRFPPFLFVALGAVLGGAGVVAAVPQKKPEPPAVKQPPRIIPVQHPDLLEFVFNPRTEAGKAAASISFYFVYKVSVDLEDKAFEHIKANWDRARSGCIDLLTGRMVKDMNTEAGKATLAKDLIAELDATLFPPEPGGEKVAQVSEVLWAKILFQ